MSDTDSVFHPLVSVVIRSMDRLTLQETLDSVGAQTYPNIEVVLVDAKGTGHRQVGERCGPFPVRFVSFGEKLRRSRAANAGLDSARGDYLIILDDDDWFEADHIEKLIAGIQKSPRFLVVYSGTKCVDSNNVPLSTEFSFPFDAARLISRNFIPIHAALFSRLLLELRCRFDESLDYCEDWDFWLQASMATDFLFIGGLSAVYRISGQSGFGVNADETLAENADLVVIQKWRERISKERYMGLIRSVRLHELKDQQLREKGEHIKSLEDLIRGKDHLIEEKDRVIQEKDHVIREKGEKHQRELAELNRYIRRQWTSLAARLAEGGKLARELEQEKLLVDDLRRQLSAKDSEVAQFAARSTLLQQRLQNLLSSRSWRITRPLRGILQLMRGAAVAEEQIPDFAQPATDEIERATRSLLVGESRLQAQNDSMCPEYQEYLACFRPCDELTDEVRWAMRAQIDAMKFRPVIAARFSLLGMSDDVFPRLLDSIRYQLYPRWELRVVDLEWATEHQKAALQEAADSDIRIKLPKQRLEGAGGDVFVDQVIDHDYIYVLNASQIPPELAFYRLVLFLIKHNYSQRYDNGELDLPTNWLRRYEGMMTAKIDALNASGQPLPSYPLISVVMPVFNTPEKWLRQAVESVLDQQYRNWELCIADDCSTDVHVRRVLEEFRDRDERIKIFFGESNRGVSSASNAALRMATGGFVVLMDHDDVLERLALYSVAESISENDVDMVYSDEAVMDDECKKVVQLVFRPAFSRELLRSTPYIVHLVGFKKSLLMEIGGFDESLNISQDYDLILRASEKAAVISHIPKILYRWRTHQSSLGHQKMGRVMEISKGVLRNHLERCHEEGMVEDGCYFNFFEIRYPIKVGQKVAIIIPTKNHAVLLRQCIESIERTVSVELNYEIVVVNHDSDEPATLRYLNSISARHKVLDYSGVFNFSNINNFAVANLDRGFTHWLFCNNDIEAINQGWLERMLELCQHADVGVVGAKLIYPDRQTIQHAGVILGVNKIAGHAGHFLNYEGVNGMPNPGYGGLLVATHEQIAVTAACMLVRRDAFEAVGGYDQDLAVGFGDTDLCIRVYQAGYRVLFCPHAVLVHHESYTRGKSEKDQHPSDTARFRQKWESLLDAGDPYYNPNFATSNGCWEIGDSPLFGLEAKQRVCARNKGAAYLLPLQNG